MTDPHRMSPTGYSQTPLWKKLGVKAGGTLLTVAAPTGFEVPQLPPGVTFVPLSDHASDGAPDEVVIAFFGSFAELEASISALGHRIFPGGALWIAWPRRAAGHDSDIREQNIRGLALPLGLVDVKVAAIEEDWSGLRLVWRRELRSAPAAPRG